MWTDVKFTGASIDVQVEAGRGVSVIDGYNRNRRNVLFAVGAVDSAVAVQRYLVQITQS